MTKHNYDELLSLLIDTCGISGFTDGINDIFLTEASNSKASAYGVDLLGSASAKFNSSFQSNVMITAHNDTIGFLVADISGDEAKLQPNAFIDTCDERPTARVVTSEGIFDVVLQEEEVGLYTHFIEDYKSIPGIAVGDPVYFHSPLLTSVRGKYTAPGMDNKSGILALIMIMHNISSVALKYNTFCVIPGLEKVGGMGSRAAADKIRPHFVINIDVRPVLNRSFLGKGPSIAVGPLLNKELNRLALWCASEYHIPHTVLAEPCKVRSDVDSMIESNGGTPCIEINIPCCGLHTNKETVSKKDIVSTSKLILKMLDNTHRLGTLVPGGGKWLAAAAKKPNKMEM